MSYDRIAGDSSVYLTALYRRTHEPQMAERWWAIAQAQRFVRADLDAVLVFRFRMTGRPEGQPRVRRPAG